MYLFDKKLLMQQSGYHSNFHISTSVFFDFGLLYILATKSKYLSSFETNKSIQSSTSVALLKIISFSLKTSALLIFIYFNHNSSKNIRIGFILFSVKGSSFAIFLIS